MNAAETGQLCVKVKRDKNMYFFMCKPLEPIEALKQKILLFHKGLESSDIRLYLHTRVKPHLYS